MQKPKQDVIDILSDLPDDNLSDDLLYDQYVIEKIKRGLEDAKNGKKTTIDELRRESESW